MAKIHGKGLVIFLNGVDLSTHTNSVEFNRMADSHDITTFGANSHVKQGGLLDGTITLKGIYDDAGTGPRAVIEPLIGQNAVTFDHRPEGTGAGKPKDTGNVLVQAYNESSPVADMITWQADLEISGDVTTVDQ